MFFQEKTLIQSDFSRHGSNWLRAFALGMLLACAAVVQAQPRILGGPAEEPDPSPMPEPLALEPGWWQYLAEVEPAELSGRIAEFSDALEASAMSLRVEQGGNLNDVLTEIDASLKAYLRLREQPPLDAHRPVTMNGEFSLEQFFSVIEERIATQQAVESEQQRIRELETDLTAERAALDRAYARYMSEPEGSAERLIQGLEVIAQRAALAVTDQRLNRLRVRLAATQSFVADLERQLVYAADHLAARPDDLDRLEETLAAARTREAEALQQRDRAQAQVLTAEQGSDLGRLEYGLRQQQLIAAELELAQARLQQALALAQIAWVTERLEDSMPVDFEQSMARWRELVSETRRNLTSWRSRVSSVLLSPLTAPGGASGRQQRQLEEQARETAQGNLAEISELTATVQQLEAIAPLVERQFTVRQGPLQRWWVRVRLLVTQLYTGSLELLNQRLFGIGEAPVTAAGILRILLIVLIAFWVSKAIRHALERLGRTRAFMSVSSIYTLGRVIHYLIMISALLIGLGSIGLDFTNLALIAGALSVGIGFGLQSIVSNFVSGLILLFERSLKVGDYVELDSGVTGHVREINIRSTRINTNDNIDVLVPNSEFVSTRLINWTLRESLARLRIPFGVAYGSDKDEVRKAALEAADEVEFTLKNMPGRDPEVWLVGFGDSSLDFELLVWVSRQGVRRPSRVKAAYLWELHTALEEYGIEIPFPQRDLHVRSGMERLSRKEPPPADEDVDESDENDHPVADSR